MGKQWKQWETLFSWAPKSLQLVTAAMKLKDACSLKENYDKPRQLIKKQDVILPTKAVCSRLWFFQWSCMDVRVGLLRRLSTKELMLLNCGIREDSWEFLGLQGDPTSPSWKKSVLNIHWKDWCWSWNSHTLATWCKELTLLKRP